MRNDDHEESLSPEQKAQIVLESQRKYERDIFIGKTIVIVIAVVNVLLSIGNLIIGAGRLFDLILQIVLSLALLYGRNWARIFFVIGLALFGTIHMNLIQEIGSSVFDIVMAIYIIVAIILLFSKYVREYMDYAKIGS